MFTFRCPACGKLRKMADDFAVAFEARCLRCGDTVTVTAELVHADAPAVKATVATGDGEAPPRQVTRRPKRSAARTGRPRPDDEERPAPRLIDYGRDETGEGDGEDECPPAPDQAPAGPEPVDAPGAGPWYRRPPILIGIAAAVVLLAGGAGASYFLSGGKARPTKKEAARTKKPAPKATQPTRPTAKAPEPKPAAVEAPKLRPCPGFFIAAPRLAAELTANAGVTDVKYRDKLLEVSGLFDGMGTRSKPAPAGTQAFFRTDGARVSCDLAGGPANLKARQGLVVGQPMTVRGVYDSEGVLRNAELVPQAAPAEAVYRGKEVELVGYVDTAQLAEDSITAFPTIRLEAETFSPLDVECLFRKNDEVEVRKVPPGALVTIRGTCSGRRRGVNAYHVRLDNCQFVYTTAPTPPTPRLSVAQFLREYGEDLRRDLLPPAGSEERLEAPRTVTQLAREFAADRRSVEQYRGKVLAVWGRLEEQTRDGLLLEGDDTDKAFRVLCRCTARNLRLLGSGPALRVRGLCTGVADGKLRLDNCEPYDPEGADARRLTADYLPHVPGRVLTYDIAAWPADGSKPVVVRQEFVDAEGGRIETVTTHRGTLPGGSLFDPGEQARWVAQPKTRKVRLPGPVYLRRQSGGFVEIGQRGLTRDRHIDIVWEPVLKVGARPGESWTWAYGDTDHTYTLEKFEERHGRSAAVVAERVVLNGDDAHPVLVRHVYVRDVGEVERQDVQQLTTTRKRVMAEKKLAEGAGTSRPPVTPAGGGRG